MELNSNCYLYAMQRLRTMYIWLRNFRPLYNPEMLYCLVPAAYPEPGEVRSHHHILLL
jgi:hypothetical protein